MHSGGLELTKLTYTGLEDILIRHRGSERCTIRCISILVVRCHYLIKLRSRVRSNREKITKRSDKGVRQRFEVRY